MKIDERLLQLDARLVRAAKGIHVLSHLSWPPSIQAEFLACHAKGSPILPRATYPEVELTDKLHALEAVADDAARTTCPISRFIEQTARSYLAVARLMEHAGSSRASDLSIEIYGQPGQPIPGSESTHVDAARYFYGISQDLARTATEDRPEAALSGRVVADAIASRIGSVIPAELVEVRVDPNLPSKAAAGATRVRLRDAACFTEFDIEQLLQHEVFVHSLSALNGRSQPRLTSLSLGAPRTTASQEGLATFAELVTGAIEIKRLERVALRIIAIDAALSGADFVEVFRLFLDAGQAESESYNSTMRIFRGVPVEGGSAFTKDGVYLQGLITTHTFFRWALRSGRLDLCRSIFAGRMSLGDVFSLDPYFASGEIIAPRYLPPWLAKTNALAANLAFSIFANDISIAEIVPESFEDRRQGG